MCHLQGVSRDIAAYCVCHQRGKRRDLHGNRHCLPAKPRACDACEFDVAKPDAIAFA